MKTVSSQTLWPTKDSKRKVLRRVSSTAAVLTVLAAAIGVPAMSPQPDAGTNPVLAIARADCPPDCGGGPGNGGTPTGPPGGGTEFVPPSIPAIPPYEAGRGYPAPDQNNGISIYNSAAPQPNQAAQPSQAPVQNQDGTYNRAANGEQQPINHNAPNNQQLNNDWQKLSDQLNQQQSKTGQLSGQEIGQSNPQDSSKTDETCESVLAPFGFSAYVTDPSGAFTSFPPALSSQAIDALARAGLTQEQCGPQEAAQELESQRENADPTRLQRPQQGENSDRKPLNCDKPTPDADELNRLNDEARLEAAYDVEHAANQEELLDALDAFGMIPDWTGATNFEDEPGGYSFEYTDNDDGLIHRVHVSVGDQVSALVPGVDRDFTFFYNGGYDGFTSPGSNGVAEPILSGWDILQFFGPGRAAKGVKGLAALLGSYAAESGDSAPPQTVEQAIAEARRAATTKALLASQRLSNVQLNYCQGKAGEKWVKDNLYPDAYWTGRSIDTDLGRRFVDILTAQRQAVEVKTGLTDYTGRIKSQIAKDAWIVANKDRTEATGGVKWVFLVSGITGKKGPTERLKDELNKAGIPWEVI